jgi:DNA methylase
MTTPAQPPPPEPPNVMYGRLLEAAHLTGYTSYRLLDIAEALLAGDAWRTVGPGFTDVNVFLRSTDLSRFNLGDGRPALVRRIKELQPEASNRAIAAAIGVSHGTVNNDIKADTGQDCPPDAELTPAGQHQPADTGQDCPPAEGYGAGAQAARLAQARRDRVKRDRDAQQRRDEQARAAAAAHPAQPTWRIEHGDFRHVLAGLRDIDAIITDPPYGREYLPLLADLAQWADTVLAPGGVLAVLLGQSWLPEAFAALGGARPYRWTAAYLTPGPGYASMQARVQSHWKPLVVYGGGPRFDDVVTVGGGDAGAAKVLHEWGQDYAAFGEIIGRLTDPGQTVADPFAGSGTTLAAAVAAGRHAVGADVDPAAVRAAQARLAG